MNFPLVGLQRVSSAEGWAHLSRANEGTRHGLYSLNQLITMYSLTVQNQAVLPLEEPLPALLCDSTVRFTDLRSPGCREEGGESYWAMCVWKSIPCARQLRPFASIWRRLFRGEPADDKFSGLCPRRRLPFERMPSSDELATLYRSLSRDDSNSST